MGFATFTTCESPKVYRVQIQDFDKGECAQPGIWRQKSPGKDPRYRGWMQLPHCTPGVWQVYRGMCGQKCCSKSISLIVSIHSTLFSIINLLCKSTFKARIQSKTSSSLAFFAGRVRCNVGACCRSATASSFRSILRRASGSVSNWKQYCT